VRRLVAAALPLALALALASCATPKPRSAVVGTHEGAVVVWDEGASHFQLEVPGQRLTPTRGLPGASLVVDGVPVQILTVRIDRLAQVAACDGEALRCHRDWELDQRRSLLGAELAVRELAAPAPGFVAWGLAMPAEIQGNDIDAAEQFWATRVVGDVIVVVSVTQLEGQPEGSAEALLGSIAASFQQFSEPRVEAIERETKRREALSR
jgi:hypothetical protein